MLQRREDYSIEEMVRFVYTIYGATEGKYPLLEWVEEKPPVNDFNSFKSIYEPFLRKRMEEEFDENYVWGGECIEATVALVYKFEGKNIGWIPPHLKREGNAFIEFFMVSPLLWGKGYGKKILSFAVKRIKGMDREAYISTSRHIDAYTFYKKYGFYEVGQHGIFIIMKYDWGIEDL